MSKNEITILGNEIVICSYCGDKIFKEKKCYLIQTATKTEIRHEECLEENLK